MRKGATAEVDTASSAYRAKHLSRLPSLKHWIACWSIWAISSAGPAHATMYIPHNRRTRNRQVERFMIVLLDGASISCQVSLPNEIDKRERGAARFHGMVTGGAEGLSSDPIQGHYCLSRGSDGQDGEGIICSHLEVVKASLDRFCSGRYLPPTAPNVTVPARREDPA